MTTMASQITSLMVVYSTVYSGADQRKYQSSASLAFVRGIHRGPVNSPHKWPVTRKMFPFDNVIMYSHQLSACHVSETSINRLLWRTVRENLGTVWKTHANSQIIEFVKCSSLHIFTVWVRYFVISHPCPHFSLTMSVMWNTGTYCYVFISNPSFDPHGFWAIMD